MKKRPLWLYKRPSELPKERLANLQREGNLSIGGHFRLAISFWVRLERKKEKGGKARGFSLVWLLDNLKREKGGPLKGSFGEDKR